MARYRKIDPRIWNDRGFMALRSESKLVFLYLLTHPGLTRLGVMRASLPGLAAELTWNLPRFTKALDPLLQQDMVRHDPDAAFLWVKNFLKFNKPESPNVVRSWRHVWPEIPECDFKAQLSQTLKDYMKGFDEGFNKAFKEVFPLALAEPFGQPSPNPEPDPEPEQEHEENSAPAQDAPAPVALIPTCNKNVEYPVTELKISEWQESYPGVNVAKELRTIRQWSIDNPKKRKTLRGVPRFVNNWLSRAQDKPKPASSPGWYVEKMKAAFDAAHSRLVGSQDVTESDLLRMVKMCCDETNLEFREDVFRDLLHSEN